MEEAEKASPDAADLDRRFRMAGIDASGAAREFKAAKTLF
jgi:twitching motility protein PilT